MGSQGIEVCMRELSGRGLGLTYELTLDELFLFCSCIAADEMLFSINSVVLDCVGDEYLCGFIFNI